MNRAGDILMENKNYQAIHTLDKLLTEAGVPHTKKRLYDGWQICYYQKYECIATVIQHFKSRGSGRDLLEMLGLCNTDVEGYLTTHAVFERIKRHYDGVLEDRKRERMSGMKCNYCSTEMLDIYYAPDYICGRLEIYNSNKRGHDRVGYVQYCPKCGNLQVNLKKDEATE